MSGDRTGLEELRRAFDASFAAEPTLPAEQVDLIALRAGSRSFAVRVQELASVARLGRVVPFPCEEPALLGIAGVKGAPLPVYELAALLGEPRSERHRWLIVPSGTAGVAFAFDELEGYLRVPQGQLVPGPAEGGAAELVREGATMRPLLSLAAVLRRLERWIGLHPRSAER